MLRLVLRHSEAHPRPLPHAGGENLYWSLGEVGDTPNPPSGRLRPLYPRLGEIVSVGGHPHTPLMGLPS